MRRLQLIDMTMILQVAMAVAVITVILEGWLSFGWLIVLVLSYPIASMVFPLSIMFYARKFSKKAFYNPITKIVEIHIGRNSSSMKLAGSVLNAVRLAKKMEKNVIFYTNHFSEERLKEKWGDKIEINKTGLFRKILFYTPYYLVTLGKKKENRYPLIECELISSKF